MDDRRCTKDDLAIVGEVADMCAQSCMNMRVTRTQRSTRHPLDSRSVSSSCPELEQEWCDKKVGDTKKLSQMHVGPSTILSCQGETASARMLGLLRDADVAGDVPDSKSTSGSMLCIVGDHTFVSIS